MRTFNYSKIKEEKWDSEVLGLIAAIYRYAGKQELHLRQRPDELDKLVEIAKIQSTEASNAIEGIVTTNTRIKQLVEEKTTPKNRAEEEIAGYRDVLGVIHESFDAIPITQNYILQLHKMLYSHMNNPFAGRTKTVQNYISATYPDGHTEVLFTPMAPFETPEALDRICGEYNRVIGNFEEEPDFLTNGRLDDEVSMFGRTKEEILGYKDSIMGPIMVVLEDDMLTVKEEPRHIIPYAVKGTSFEKHPFFEGSSMRKVGDKYYFVYSSWQNHELCYAVSDYPDHGFTFGGTIVSNGDVGYKGRSFENKLNMTGTTHGSIECIDGQWYVFYHRLTHKSDYSRQACAEKIYIAADGHIDQVEVTSCGLNDGPLVANGTYPAVIACNLTNGHMPHGSNSIYTTEFPNVTNKGEDRFIAEIEDGTLIGYKYFALEGSSTFGVNVRYETDDNKVVYEGPVRVDERCENQEQIKDANDLAENVEGYFDICVTEDSESIGRIDIPVSEDISETEWRWCENKVDFPEGVHAVYLVYRGRRKVQLKDIRFRKILKEEGEL